MRRGNPSLASCSRNALSGFTQMLVADGLPSREGMAKANWRLDPHAYRSGSELAVDGGVLVRRVDVDVAQTRRLARFLTSINLDLYRGWR